MKSHDKNDMVKALTPRGVNLSDKSFLLVAFFLFFLFTIPFLSAETSCTYVDTPGMQISLLNCNIPNTNPLCLTGSGGTVLTAPTISLLNCRIPNTNPLCWFYYFGIGLLQKNIILINGGILNII